MNIALKYLYRITYGISLFTVTVRYSVGLFVIQIVKVMYIALIYLHSSIYGVSLFTVTVVIQLVSSLFKS